MLWWFHCLSLIPLLSSCCCLLIRKFRSTPNKSFYLLIVYLFKIICSWQFVSAPKIQSKINIEEGVAMILKYTIIIGLTTYNDLFRLNYFGCLLSEGVCVYVRFCVGHFVLIVVGFFNFLIAKQRISVIWGR